MIEYLAQHFHTPHLENNEPSAPPAPPASERWEDIQISISHVDRFPFLYGVTLERAATTEGLSLALTGSRAIADGD